MHISRAHATLDVLEKY